MNSAFLRLLLPVALAVAGCSTPAGTTSNHGTPGAADGERKVAAGAQGQHPLKQVSRGQTYFPSTARNSFFPGSNSPQFDRTSTIGADVYQTPGSTGKSTAADGTDIESVSIPERR